MTLCYRSGMRYQGAVIRPPSEADSLILQVTYGCSNNGCTFCSTYLEKPFRVRPFSEVVDDVRSLPLAVKRHARRVFLADGDALMLPQSRLLELLSLLNEEFPGLERVSSYATAQSLLRKSPEQLALLAAAGLTLLFLGLESGDEATLEACNKRVTVAEQVEASRRAIDAGMSMSVTAILGLAGVERSQVHAAATGRALSAIDPQFIGVLSLMVVEGTPLARSVASGEFVVPDPLSMLTELRTILAHTDVTDALFRSNHASNYVSVGGRLPADKQSMLSALDSFLDAPDRGMMRPESWRAL